MIKKTIRKKVFDKDSFSLDSFIEASSEYLETKNEIPVLLTESSPKFEFDRMKIEVYFYDKLLEEIIRNKNKYSRDLKDLVLYGYVGSSRGGKNGLVAVSDRDKNLSGIVEKFNAQRYRDFCNRIGILEENIKLNPVKLVTHRKSGERIIGVFNKTRKETVLYEIRSYNK